jgi:hypothetical protein
VQGDSYAGTRAGRDTCGNTHGNNSYLSDVLRSNLALRPGSVAGHTRGKLAVTLTQATHKLAVRPKWHTPGTPAELGPAAEGPGASPGELTGEKVAAEPWISGSVDQWISCMISGPADQWISGSVDQWISGSVEDLDAQVCWASGGVPRWPLVQWPQVRHKYRQNQCRWWHCAGQSNACSPALAAAHAEVLLRRPGVCGAMRGSPLLLLLGPVRRTRGTPPLAQTQRAQVEEAAGALPALQTQGCMRACAVHQRCMRACACALG